MKFASAVSALFIAIGIAEVDGMSIRGNTKSANKLMTLARRLENAGGYGNGGYNNGGNNYNGQTAANNGYGGYGGYYGEMEEEELYFLNNYSIKLMSCIQGEQVINYENGEMDSSTVTFRLCPSDSCDADSSMGCDSGYGDFAIGINVFLEAYMDQQQQNDQYYGNEMLVYNQNGQEFDAQEYMECKEYNVEQDENQQQQYNYNYNYNYNNGQNNNNNNNGYYENAQFFIGPSCSTDGTTISLGMYMDEACSYPAQASFADIAYGWDSGLPFSDGGLISMNCVACYGPNENYEWELSEMCTESYQSSTSRCEVNMETTSYYGQNTQGCSYITGLVESIYGSGTNKTDIYNTNSTSSSDWTNINAFSTQFMNTLNTREARAFIAAMVLFCLSAFFGALLITCFCVKKRKERKRRRRRAAANSVKKLLPEAQPAVKRRSSVVALVRSGTNSIRESVKTTATGAKLVVATAAAKSVASMKKTEGGIETVKTADYRDMKDDASVKGGSASVKSHKSITSRMSSMAAKTVASVKSISSQRKVVDTVPTKSHYKAPEPIISAPATASVKSTQSSAKSAKRADSVKSSTPKEMKLAPIAAVVAATVLAAPLIAKEDASAPEPVESLAEASGDASGSLPETTTAATEYKPDALDYIFGGCVEDEAVDKVAIDDSSITPDTTGTVLSSEPTLAVTEPVVNESTPEPDTKITPTTELIVVETVSEPALESEVATTEPEKLTKVEPSVEEKVEATEVKESSDAPAVIEEIQAEDVDEETKPVIDDTSSKSSSVKTEKTKGSKGSFLSKMDSHLKKKLSKKAMKGV